MFTQKKAEYAARSPWAYTPDTPMSTLQPPTPEVNSNLHPIDREASTLEAERNEVVLQPNGNVYNVLGNRHNKGKDSGTPLNLPPNSFIYSNHKPLAISKDDKELFQFKEGGRYKPKNNTPAAILKKEVNIPHHNKMIAITGSDDHDRISKKSAELMLNKNFTKLGQVAFLQEEKKGFPDGLPSFAQGTAPLSNIQQQENIQKQYLKGGRFQMGGKINNPWMANPDERIAPPVAAKCARNPYHPDCTPSRRRFLTPPPHVTLSPFHDPNMDLPAPERDVPQLPPVTPLTPRQPGSPYQTPTKEDEPILPYEPNVPLSPSQKFTLGYDAYNAANVNRYYPKREQVSFTPLTSERVNAQPFLNQVDNSVSEAYGNNSLYNPIIARAQNSSIYGKALEQRSQISGNVGNQNKQIANQEAQYNNQGYNNTSSRNVQLDQGYYDQVQQLNQSFDSEKRFATNNLVSQYNQYKSSNDQLQMQLASQQTPGSIDVWQSPDGNIYKDPSQAPLSVRNRLVKRKQAAPLYDYNSRTGNVYYTGAGMSLDQLPAQTDGFSFQQLKQYADEFDLGEKGKAYALAAWLKQNSPYRGK